jgi:hypothetical protein
MHPSSTTGRRARCARKASPCGWRMAGPTTNGATSNLDDLITSTSCMLICVEVMLPFSIAIAARCRSTYCREAFMDNFAYVNRTVSMLLGCEQVGRHSAQVPIPSNGYAPYVSFAVHDDLQTVL